MEIDAPQPSASAGSSAAPPSPPDQIIVTSGFQLEVSPSGIHLVRSYLLILTLIVTNIRYCSRTSIATLGTLALLDCNLLRNDARH